MEATTLTTFLADITEVFQASIGWIGDVVDTIVSEPMLLVATAGVTLVGFAVGLTSRLIRI